MPKHKDQRVGVFVDVQNLYYSAKQFYSAKVNFAHILKMAVSGRQLIRAIAYVIKADVKEESNFFEALEKIGYDVRSKDLQTFYTGAKKGDWDVGIAMDIMRMAAKLDVIVLVSGDGDFKDLLEHVKALGCRAEVIAFRKTSSSRLLEEADEMTDLGKDLNKALIKDQKYARKVGNNNRSRAVPQTKSQSRPPSRSRPQSRSQSRPSRPRPPRGRRPYQNQESDSEASFLQRINMDQPNLTGKETTTKLVMPKETKKVEKTKKITKTVKKEEKRKPVVKKKPVKKKPTKKTSVVKKVIKKVTKKK